MQIKRGSVVFFLMLMMIQFSGCALWKFMMGKGEKQIPPRLLALPFYCENYKIAEDITKGFKEEISPKIELIDLKNFDSYLSSHPIKMSDYYPASKSSGTLTSLSKKEVKSSSSTLAASSPFENLINDLFDKEEIREKFYRESGLDYVVVGNAKEMKLDELQVGNLVTAETAEMKLLELKTGEILLDESFKQGLFEIVAPDRIGKKLASKVNSKLNQIQQENKRALEEKHTPEKYKDLY